MLLAIAIGTQSHGILENALRGLSEAGGLYGCILVGCSSKADPTYAGGGRSPRVCSVDYLTAGSIYARGGVAAYDTYHTALELIEELRGEERIPLEPLIHLTIVDLTSLSTAPLHLITEGELTGRLRSISLAAVAILLWSKHTYQIARYNSYSIAAKALLKLTSTVIELIVEDTPPKEAANLIRPIAAIAAGVAWKNGDAAEDSIKTAMRHMRELEDFIKRESSHTTMLTHEAAKVPTTYTDILVIKPKSPKTPTPKDHKATTVIEVNGLSNLTETILAKLPEKQPKQRLLNAVEYINKIRN